MKTYQIEIHRAADGRKTVPEDIEMASGDQITITADHDAASILCFGADTAAVLLPTPSMHVELAGGASVTYTVGTVDPLKYIVMVQSHGWPAPTVIRAATAGPSPSLHFRYADGKDFPGPSDPPFGT
jgi:hypothetical protein